MNPGDGSSVLVARAGGRLAAFGMNVVRETMRPMPCRPVAGFPAWMLGIAIVRGAPAPVIDLGALLSGSPSQAPTRFISLRATEGVFVAAVDEVVGIRSLDPTTMSRLPPLLAAAGDGAILGHAAIAREVLVLLDAVRLVPPEAWLAASGAETRA